MAFDPVAPERISVQEEYIRCHMCGWVIPSNPALLRHFPVVEGKPVHQHCARMDWISWYDCVPFLPPSTRFRAYKGRVTPNSRR